MYERTFSIYCVVSILVFALLGCSPGSGLDLDSNGRPLSEGGDVPLAADYGAIQANVFTPICTVCHAGASAPVGLKLDEASSYNLLVGVSSVQSPSTLRVEPGNPDASYLIAKLEGTAAVGAQMPLGGPFLPQSTIDLIRQWISEGAPPPPTVLPPASQPPTVSSTNPVDGAFLVALPTAMNVVFSHAIDAASITASSIVLERSGGDDSFTEGNEVAVAAVSVTLSTANDSLVNIDLTGVTSVDDRYRLTVVGNQAGSVQDLNGNVLDGDGDGISGGDYTMDFVVSSSGPVLAASWRSIQDTVFTPICIVCHSGAGAPEGLQLDEANSFNQLVNVPSAQEPAVTRVAPLDPDNSYLIQKLEGTAASGSRMPRGGPFLQQATIDVIRQWISDGALNEGAPPGPPATALLSASMQLVGSLVSGDETILMVTVENPSTQSVTGAMVGLSWSPADAFILRSGLQIQTIATLEPATSTTLSWELRGDEPSPASVTITVTESSGAITTNTNNIVVTE